jgi:hypothetical protein
MTLNDLQRAAVVLFAAREAGPDGSLDQMRAICRVIRNRVQAQWYEDYLAAVEGSWTRRRMEELAEKQPPLQLSDRRLATLTKEIEGIVYGQTDDEIAKLCARQDKEHGPLLYWCWIDRPMTPWFEQNIVRKPEEHRQRAQVGNNMYLYE